MCYGSRVTTRAEYRQAAIWLWGAAGEYAADESARVNREYFAGSVPPLPVVIGITAYGHCLGLTRGRRRAIPRISLASRAFNHGGPRTVFDLILHEVLHAFLMLRGEDPAHNAAPWCAMITELTPAVITGAEILAAPVGTTRVPNPARERDPQAPKTRVVRRARDGHLTQDQLARWPHSVRPEGYYDGQQPIPVDTY